GLDTSARFLADIRTLVAAGEKPSADTLLLEAHYWQQHATLIEQAQHVADTAQYLRQIANYPSGEIHWVPVNLTPLESLAPPVERPDIQAARFVATAAYQTALWADQYYTLPLDFSLGIQNQAWGTLS